MRILIDIGHPAHVHLFKHFAWQMQIKGHSILFTVRSKEHEVYLLNKYGFKYIYFGRHYTSKSGKIIGIMRFDLKMFHSAVKFKPDIFISHGSIYAAHVSWLIRKPHISLEDTFNFEQIRLYKSFTSCILTANYNHPDLGNRCINYSGYHELAYLHPKLFTPDIIIKNLLGITEKEKYTVLRFVSWKSSHDYGHNGISIENKILAVKEFLKHGRVFISSEKELPVEINNYRIQIPPERMHDAIAFSSLFFGESATMASEAAMLGVPAIFLDNSGRYYTKDLETNYGLIINYSESGEDQLKAIEKGAQLLASDNVKYNWQTNRIKMLNKKINVSAFLVWFVENWPASFGIMKKNPNYEDKFRE